MMKYILVPLLLFFACGASAQVQDMYSKSGKCAVGWVTLQKSNYQRIFRAEILNDSTSGTDSLFIAFDSDTTVARRFYLLYGESIWLEDLSVQKIMLRSSTTDSIPYRARYH